MWNLYSLIMISLSNDLCLYLSEYSFMLQTDKIGRFSSMQTFTVSN